MKSLLILFALLTTSAATAEMMQQVYITGSEDSGEMSASFVVDGHSLKFAVYTRELFSPYIVTVKITQEQGNLYFTRFGKKVLVSSQGEIRSTESLWTINPDISMSRTSMRVLYCDGSDALQSYFTEGIYAFTQYVQDMYQITDAQGQVLLKFYGIHGSGPFAGNLLFGSPDCNEAPATPY